MTRVRNYDDVEWKLLIIRMAQEYPTEYNKQVAIACKKKIREFYKKVCAPKTRWTIKDEGDAYTELVELPNSGNLTYKEAYDYFESCLSIPAPNSLYDCTGKPFTIWFKPVFRRGKWYVYHRVNLDV